MKQYIGTKNTGHISYSIYSAGHYSTFKSGSLKSRCNLYPRMVIDGVDGQFVEDIVLDHPSDGRHPKITINLGFYSAPDDPYIFSNYLDRELSPVSKMGVAGSHPGSFYGLRKPRPSAPRCEKKKNEVKRLKAVSSSVCI
jgi:hypothetical protein